MSYRYSRVWGPAPEWPALPTARPVPAAPASTDAAPAADVALPSDSHRYSFSDIRTDNAERLHDFGRAMHATGASQEAVTAAIGWARSVAAAESERIATADNQHAASIKAEVSQVWGNDYQPTVRAIGVFLDRLPPVVEDAITNARTENGTKLLNTPEGVAWLATLAIGSGTAAVPAQVNSAKLEDFQKLMRLDRKAYFKDDALQLAYRRALGEPATEPALRPTASIESEINEIEQRMRTNRKAYFADAAAQARYRTLLEQRESNA